MTVAKFGNFPYSTAAEITTGQKIDAYIFILYALKVPWMAEQAQDTHPQLSDQFFDTLDRARLEGPGNDNGHAVRRDLVRTLRAYARTQAIAPAFPKVSEQSIKVRLAKYRKLESQG